MWLWIFSIVNLSIAIWACRRYVLAERRAKKALSGVGDTTPVYSLYDLRNHEGYARAMDGGEIDDLLRDLGMHEDDQVCGHTYRGEGDLKDQIITCGLGRWAHDPYHGLDHKFIPVDAERCPGHPDLPLGHADGIRHSDTVSRNGKCDGHWYLANEDAEGDIPWTPCDLPRGHVPIAQEDGKIHG